MGRLSTDEMVDVVTRMLRRRLDGPDVPGACATVNLSGFLSALRLELKTVDGLPRSSPSWTARGPGVLDATVAIDDSILADPLLMHPIGLDPAGDSPEASMTNEQLATRLRSECSVRIYAQVREARALLRGSMPRERLSQLTKELAGNPTIVDLAREAQACARAQRGALKAAMERERLLAHQVDQADQRIAELERQLHMTNQRDAEKDARIEYLFQRRLELRDRIAELEPQNRALREQVARDRVRETSMSRFLDQARRERDEARARTEELQHDVVACEAQLGRATRLARMLFSCMKRERGAGWSVAPDWCSSKPSAEEWRVHDTNLRQWTDALRWINGEADHQPPTSAADEDPGR